MSEKFNESIQLDDVLVMFETLERRLSRLENSFDVHRRAVDTMSDNVYSIYKTLMSVKANLKDIETDIDYLYTLTHGGDNFCGNCEHCVPCPDGLYRCDLTNLELDPDTSSCIRFKHPFDKSDAEICKACSDKDTPRCYKCSHFPF